jgi:oligopeptide transport system substrate-binding protein
MSRSKDRKVYTFILRRGVRFSNGDRIRVEDVRASWFRMIDPSEEAEYSSLFDVIAGAAAYRAGTVPDASKVGIRAISDFVLEVTLNSPAAYFLKLLCHHSFSVLNPDAMKKGAWTQDRAPPVSGPYVLDSVKPGEFRLIKNPFYWDAENVLIPSIRILFTNDDKDVTARFNAGEIHWLMGGFEPDILLDKAAIQFTLPMFATSYLFFRCDKKPLDDERVRRALLLLLPWDEIRSPDRYRVPARGLIVAIQGYPAAGAEYAKDPAKALETLKKAGLGGFASLPEIVIRIGEGEDQGTIASILEKAWTEAGVKVRIVKTPAGGYFQSLKGDDYALASMTWIGDFADPLTFLQMWTSGSNLNESRLSDPAFDKLVARSMSEEGATRLKTLSDAEKILLDGGACVPVYHPIAVNVISTDTMGGWASNPLDIHPFKFMYFKSGVSLEGIVKAF